MIEYKYVAQMGIKWGFDGWWGGDDFRYKPIGAGTGKKIIHVAGMGMGMGIALTDGDGDGDGDGNSNTRPAPPRLHP